MAAPHEALRVAYESSAMEKGEERLASLLTLLAQDERASDISKALSDKQYRQVLFKEYKL